MSTEPADIIATAEQDATEAANLVNALEQRVVNGDEDVTPEEFQAARELSRFAELRRKAAERKAEKAREAAAEQARAEAVREAEETLRGFSLDDMTRLRAEAHTALTALVQGLDARNAAIDAAAATLNSAGFADDRPDHWRSTLSTRGGTIGGWVRIQGEEHRAITAGDILLRLAHDIAVENGGLPRDYTKSVRATLEPRSNITDRHPIEGPRPQAVD